MNKTKENTGADVKPDNSGHRERLKKRFMLGGGRDFPDYEMLELLLTLSIPRRDVKQIAKQLLDHLIVSKNGYYSFKDHGLIAELKN